MDERKKKVGSRPSQGEKGKRKEKEEEQAEEESSVN